MVRAHQRQAAGQATCAHGVSRCVVKVAGSSDGGGSSRWGGPGGGSRQVVLVVRLGVGKLWVQWGSGAGGWVWFPIPADVPGCRCRVVKVAVVAGSSDGGGSRWGGPGGGSRQVVLSVAFAVGGSGGGGVGLRPEVLQRRCFGISVVCRWSAGRRWRGLLWRLSQLLLWW
jgi:hypothetical protein